MLLEWFNAREAVEVGTSLADSFVPKAKSVVDSRVRRPGQAGAEVQKFLRQAVREARPLKMNLLRRAKLLGSFKWRLVEHGLEQSAADEFTHMLLLQLSGIPAPVSAAGSSAASAPKRAARKQVPALLADVESLFQKGAYAEAVVRLNELLQIDPNNALVHGKLGDAMCRLGRYSAGEQAFRRAIVLKPNSAEAHFNLGTVLRWKGDFAASETSMRRAVKQDPRNLDALVGLGNTLGARQRLTEAADCFDKALRMMPRHAAALCGLGWIASLEGRFEQAERLLRASLDVDPNCSDAWAWLADARKMTVEDKAWLEGAQRALASGLPPIQEAKLRFAMGKYFNDLGEYSRAFDQYQRANEMFKPLAPPYDRARQAASVDEMIRVYTRERLAQPVKGASDSTRAVFVVGMMRSGTSLVEQIIASHPDAVGAGELDFWHAAVRKHRETLQRGPPDASLTAKLAESYLKVLNRHSADAPRVVDKATFNSDYLGLIHAVFPNARILYLRRDPVDTCLSCYFQDFANMASFTLDLSDLAHYYREHHRLVQHWRSVLPKEVFMDVPYAELVADQESWSRKIIEFLGLPWDPRVLEFHKTERAVITASNWQVRQKMYSSSVGRWRNYQKFIGPLLDLRKLG